MVNGFVAELVTENDAHELDGAAWDGPRFDVPTLALSKATAGEITLAAEAHHAGYPTNDVDVFKLAVQETTDLEHAAALWAECLEAGEMKAHFGLGYTLFEQRQHREAYKHLRYYARLCQHNAWAWCWLGKAAQALGERSEAQRAFERAIACEERGGYETDASELLSHLLARSS